MRSLSLVCLLLAVTAVAAAPQLNVCSPEKVQLELRPLGSFSGRSPSGEVLSDYQLAFVALDNNMAQNKADWIDIHYRVNNEDSVNMRVLTEAALTSNNARAKQAQVDGIQLEAGDVIRAYATYSSNGIACDTPIHTFNAPSMAEMQPTQRLTRRQRQMMLDNDMDINAIMRSPSMRRPYARAEEPSAEDQFWTAAAVEAEINTMQGACPGIAVDQDIFKQSNTMNSYVLSFENKTPARQLHYVDLHITKDGQEWDNLRLASDMQLDLAHKVMQPGIVVRPNEQLAWYWTYRTSASDGSTVDCSTEIETITAQEVMREVNLQQLSVQ